MRLRELLRVQAQTEIAPPITKANFCGLPVSIEYPKNSMRIFRNEAGDVVYRKLMQYPYGFLDGSTGRDGDEIDCILGPNQQCKQVFVMHMKDMGPDVGQREDEDKVLLGFDSYIAALSAFHANYPLKFFGGATVLSINEFKDKLAKNSGGKLHAMEQKTK
jgi:hypothetical protein